jgi:hypothetical protein
MRKKYFFVLIIMGITTLCYAQSKYYVTPWVRNFFFDFNVLYNFEQLKPKPQFDAHNVLLEIGLGYDFGRITARVYGDFGFLLDGTAYWSNGTKKISESLDAKNWKLGLEPGIKIINGERFDLILPLGIMFNWTEYNQKNPSYISSNVAYDRYWKYYYINVYTGLNASIQFGNHIKMLIFSNIGYPIQKDYEYGDVLKGNYVWAGTGSSTYRVKNDVDILTFSAGIGMRVNF